MPEWSNGAVSKTVDPFWIPGFESLSLRKPKRDKRYHCDTSCFFIVSTSLACEDAMEKQEWRLCALVESRVCKGPCGKQKGKATAKRSVAANPLTCEDAMKKQECA